MKPSGRDAFCGLCHYFDFYFIDEFYNLSANMLGSFQFLEDTTGDQRFKERIKQFNHKSLGLYSSYSRRLTSKNIEFIDYRVPRLGKEIDYIFIVLGQELMCYAIDQT
ncbi:hypothetical protein [Acinetobacter indicus]|uniref:hypothetical protein n=1 Tax=Acinetobacter indicus TaxID=756892 RepID=UPI000CEBFD31|nr:hypothetical protein [Acinetobacter indicus]